MSLKVLKGDGEVEDDDVSPKLWYPPTRTRGVRRQKKNVVNVLPTSEVHWKILQMLYSRNHR